MRTTIKGTPELKARLRALRLAFKPIGKDWATSTAAESNRTAPRGRTGRLSKSHKVKNATQRRATVYAIFYARFVNRGAGPHEIRARRKPMLIFQASGRTIFTKKVNHRGMRGTRYVDRAAQHALRKHATAAKLIEEWNRAA